MDARQVRTRLVLAQAILELGAARSVGDISVTDVATRAGVSRPTFYAHTDSPGALLGSVLDEELAQLRYPGDLTAFLVGTAEHVKRNRALYRNNVRLRLPPELRDPLLDHLERGFTEHLVRHPALLPAMPVPAASPASAPRGDAASGQGDTTDDRSLDRQLFAAMTASCTVAAFENWLRSPDAVTPEVIVEFTLLGIAEWWNEPALPGDGQG